MIISPILIPAELAPDSLSIPFIKNPSKYIGIGLNYKVNSTIEFYGNISQNYRSVTFADISITNPAYAINPDIDDEKGFTADMGFRGNFQNKISYTLIRCQ